MEFRGVTFTGPAPDDDAVLGAVPGDLRALLEEVNGLVAYGGGLHLRGACLAPEWHSLADVWTGPRAFHERYDAVEPGDVPFAQDALGDQWLLRDGRVVHLAAEYGGLQDRDQTLDEFLRAVVDEPTETLGLHPLLQFQ